MAKGTIDQLNFEVLLHDEKFAARVQKDIDLAKKLNTSLTEILTVRKNINSTYAAAATGAKQEAKAAEQTAKAHARAQAAIEKSAKTMGGSGNSLLRGWLRFSATLWSIIGIVRILANAIGSFVKKIAEFQQANANLATIMQVSRREIKTLTEDALMLGRTTEWTASQVTELQTALAKLGYNIPQIRNMQASVLQFATAVGANLPDAANLAGASLRMFGMHSTEMQKTLEILTASTNKTALDFEKLKVALPYVGAIAHSIGFDVADTSALLGVLANSGLAASRSGTGLRKVLLELSKENGKLQTAMGGGIKTFDDFVNGLQALRDRGLEAGEAQKLVGDRAGAALLILANGVDDVRRLNKEVRDTDGLLKDIQAERLDTLHGSTLLLKSAWEGLIQTFRDSAGPMKTVVDWLTQIVRWTSLAAGRANRVAQGGKIGPFAERITGSDDLTKQFKQQYDGLIANGTSPEEAAKIVNRDMQIWLSSAREYLIDLQKKGYKENGWNRLLYNSIVFTPYVAKKMEKGRAANEQVEAIENAMDAMADYMANFSTEEAEIAANEYLDKFTSIFDEEGADAARAAMSSLEKEMIDKGVDVGKIRQRVDAYIANGGSEGASARGAGSNADAEREHRERIERLKNEAANLKKLADAYEKLEPYLGKGTEAKMAELFGPGDYSRDSLEEQIRKIAAALRELGQDGASVAEGIEKTWGLDELSVTLKRLSVAEDAKKLAEDAQKLLWTYKPAAGLAKKTPQAQDGQFDPKKWREIAKQARYIANQFLIVSNSLKTFADASGNQALSDAASRIGAIAETLKEVGNGYRQGGVWGAVAGGVASALKQIIDGMTAAEQEAAKIRDIVRDIRQETENEAFKNAMADGVDGIFGENAIRRLKNAVSLLNEVRNNLAALEYKKPEWSFLGYKDEELPDVHRWQAIQKGQYGEMPFVTNHSWLVGDTTRTLEELAKEFNLAMTDENGFLNPKLLQAILDNYGELNQGAVDWLTDSIRLAEEYTEALKQVDESTKAVFGNIASQAADNIVDGWIEAGNAALDYVDILDDVAKSYAKMLVQSVIMETFLDPITEDLKESFKSGDYEKAMAIIAGAMDGVAGSAPIFEEILRAFDPYFKRSESTSGSGGLSSGIKSITEETAGLLASYINAIRADVSYIRMMQERGWEHINAFGAALPTLNDHIAQIAATNFDIAQSNQSILAELRSVIGPVGTSGMVVRVENA